MTRLTLLTLIAALGLAPSSADAKKDRRAKKSKTASKAKKVKSYDFLADDIDGSRIRPDGTSIFGIQNVEHSSLIRLRPHFIPEILKSAEKI